MVSNGGEQQHIRCEIVPIPTAHAPKHALFFHRFQDQSNDYEHCTDISSPSCSIHNGNPATMQCIDCVKLGLPLQQSYHCSQKCFLDSWKKHLFYHLHTTTTTTNSSLDDIAIKMQKIERCKRWPPADTISLFDERLEVVGPVGKSWVTQSGSSDIVVPVADHVGFSFKLGSSVSATDPAIQRRHLSYRRVLQVADLRKSERLGVTQKVSTTFGSFGVLSYNILSDMYTHSDRYFYCPQWALAWDYRQRNLLNEILLYDADILCLQEVQSDHFENFFRPELMKFGYSAVYKKKTNQVYTGSGYTSEGCAIFFRNNAFKEVIAYELEFSKTALALIEKLQPSQRDQAKIRLIKDNVALAVILETVESTSLHEASRSRLCVVCTHIYASKNSPDVKLLQVSDLINEIEKVVDQGTPLLICGDLNSVPESDPYILLANHKMNPALRKEANDPLEINQHLKLQHSMKLRIAWKLKVSWRYLTMVVLVGYFPHPCGHQTILLSWEDLELPDHSLDDKMFHL